MAPTRPKGGVGSNQYQIRGHSRIHTPTPALRLSFDPAVLDDGVPLMPAAARDAAASPDLTPAQAALLFDRIMTKMRNTKSGLPPTALAQARNAILGRPDCPRSVLRQGAKIRSPSVAKVLIEHPRCHEIADKISSNVFLVAAEITAGGQTPESYLGHTSSTIRKAVAGRRLPLYRHYQALASDRDTDVRAALAANPYCPPDILVNQAVDSAMVVREAVAHNPSAPLEALARLMTDQYGSIRQTASKHPNLPDHIKTIVTLSS